MEVGLNNLNWVGIDTRGWQTWVKQISENYTARSECDVVLFLPRPQTRGRKSLCNLRNSKPSRVDFTRQQMTLAFIKKGSDYV